MSVPPITDNSGLGSTTIFPPIPTTHTPRFTSPTGVSIPLTDIQPIGYDATATDDAGSLPTDAGISAPSNGPGGNSGLATSAALYLYTFLATLVLLLVVSAAILIRSFILRRRNRRMIEEAVRNGTWVPPIFPDWDGPGRGKVKVDLSKKPKMWEAYMGEVRNEKTREQAEYVNSPTGEGRIFINSTWRSDGSKDQWDSIWPFAASYKVPTENPGADANEETVTEHAPLGRRRLRMPMPPPRVMLSRITRGWSVHSPVDAGESPPTDPTIPMHDLHNHHQKHLATMISPTPMRVAVIIKMPTPPSAPPTSPASLQSASASGSLSSSRLPTLSSISTRIPQDEEEPLPHIELGVAEVMLLPRLQENEESDDDSSDLTESDFGDRVRGSQSIER